MPFDPIARLVDEQRFMEGLPPQIRRFIAQANPQAWDKPLLDELQSVADLLMVRADTLRTDLAAQEAP